MAKCLVLIALMLMCLPGFACAGRNEAGVIPVDSPEMHDRAKDNACDCCQKCNAAKSAIKPEVEEGGNEPDGCEDCCAKCGKELQPRTDETPPEVIEKHIPPEIKGK